MIDIKPKMLQKITNHQSPKVDNRKGGEERLEGVPFRALDRFCCCHTVKREIWHTSQPDGSVKSHHRSGVDESAETRSVWKRENKSEWKEQHGSCWYSFPFCRSAAAAARSGWGSLLALLVLVRQDHFIRVVVENGRDGRENQARSSHWTSVRQEQLTLSRACNLKEFKITFIELQTHVKHMDIFTHLIKIDLLKSGNVMTEIKYSKTWKQRWWWHICPHLKGFHWLEYKARRLLYSTLKTPLCLQLVKENWYYGLEPSPTGN